MPHFIFIQQISLLNILNMLYNLHFFPSKCCLFHNATLFGFCITHILNTWCAKIWKKKSVSKRLMVNCNVKVKRRSLFNAQHFKKKGQRAKFDEVTMQYNIIIFPNSTNKIMFGQNKQWLTVSVGEAKEPFFHFEKLLNVAQLNNSGRDSSVVIATRYGLDGPVIESWCGRDFPHPSRPPQPPVQWVPGLSRG